MRGAVTVERVHAIASDDLRRLGLLPFTLHVTVHLQPGEEGDDQGPNTQAWIEVFDGYKEADIHVRDWMVRAGQLADVVHHEVAHIIHWRAFAWLLDRTRSSDHSVVMALREECACQVAAGLSSQRRRRTVPG